MISASDIPDSLSSSNAEKESIEAPKSPSIASHSYLISHQGAISSLSSSASFLSKYLYPHSKLLGSLNLRSRLKGTQHHNNLINPSNTVSEVPDIADKKRSKSQSKNRIYKGKNRGEGDSDMLESNNSIELQNLKNTYCSMEFTVDGRIHDNSDGISSSGRGADHPSTCQLKDGDEKMHTSGGKAHSSMTVSSTSVSNPQNLGLSISLTSPDLVQLSSSYNSNIQISNSSLAPLAESSPTSNLASSASGSLENLEFQPTSDAASNIASVLATNDTDPIMEDQITDESHEKSKLVNTISTTAGHIMTKPTNDPMQVDPDVIYLHPNHSLIENPNQSTSAAIDSGILFNSSSEVDHSIKKLAEFKLDTENGEKSGQV
ncbi:hypothetical protein BKA69DRAFT_92274 [Paraphysoderma sedebokerense]|nr:hypothetical protein BKA69DRAFT_92274 [Paraphysoderma sedebokerense]